MSKKIIIGIIGIGILAGGAVGYQHMKAGAIEKIIVAQMKKTPEISSFGKVDCNTGKDISCTVKDIELKEDGTTYSIASATIYDPEDFVKVKNKEFLNAKDGFKADYKIVMHNVKVNGKSLNDIIVEDRKDQILKQYGSNGESLLKIINEGFKGSNEVILEDKVSMKDKLLTIKDKFFVKIGKSTVGGKLSISMTEDVLKAKTPKNATEFEKKRIAEIKSSGTYLNEIAIAYQNEDKAYFKKIIDEIIRLEFAKKGEKVDLPLFIKNLKESVQKDIQLEMILGKEQAKIVKEKILAAIDGKSSEIKISMENKGHESIVDMGKRFLAAFMAGNPRVITEKYKIELK